MDIGGVQQEALQVQPPSPQSSISPTHPTFAPPIPLYLVIMAAVIILLFLLVVLFASVDVWYFIRSFQFILKAKLGLKKRHYSLKNVLSPVIIHGIVLPSDIDHLMHMNNSKYLREMDFGRIKLYFESGILETARRLGVATLVAAISIRYRRSLQLWERFSLSTKVLHWSGDAFYLEQRFINKDGFICAIAMVKMIAKGKSGRVAPDEIVRQIVGEGESHKLKSPPATPELNCWMESLEKSSESMKKEGVFPNSQRKDL